MSLLEAHAGLAGKVAVVVGGAGGFMGRGVTLGLARAGVRIAACDNDEEAVRTIVPDVEAVAISPVSRLIGGRRLPTLVAPWRWSSVGMAFASI
jgi:NAD(P)-dependent dehydrogenase (short-subunit alcohol dehydrogenase family)